jgi:hypothetical protein
MGIKTARSNPNSSICSLSNQTLAFNNLSETNINIFFNLQINYEKYNYK